MPVQPTYPGVYVQELPSGVRTIVGVSTSVTAFVGEAKRGPINKPVKIFNYSEYEKRFGGLQSSSEMSYSVRSFFLNGGSQAIIVRVAGNTSPATVDLPTSAPAAPSLTITALEPGLSGNNIEVRIDYNTTTPNSTFNLSVSYTDPDSPGNSRTEFFANLSMAAGHPRYVAKDQLVNGISEFIVVTRTAATAVGSGNASSGNITAALNTLIDSSHNQFRIAVNGGAPQTVTLDPVPANLAALATFIDAASADWACALNGTSLVITSATAGENSRVEILSGLSNDVSVRLQLGPANGGDQVDAAASIRPAQSPLPSTYTTAAITGPIMNGASDGNISVSLDGNLPQRMPLEVDDAIFLALAVGDRRIELASRIQAGVRALRPGVLGYDAFTASVDGSTIVLTSGSRGAGSAIQIANYESDTLAADLLLVGTGSIQQNTVLTGGTESALDPADAYSSYIGSRSLRQGIYALEGEDIFNILVLPGIDNSGILMDSDAYCKERRAFMIVDAPRADVTPSQIATRVDGSSLPKSDYAAIYYPWIQIPDPLNGGQPRLSAPSGAMAGLYSRTDTSRGVWKAPAGTDATLNSVTGLGYVLTDPENGSLNPLGINCLRNFPVYGPVSWGARTLRGNDQMASEWKYVPVRRTALFIEESLYRGLKWVVFEPNDEPLWAQIRLNVGAFMQNLFRQGAFQGQKRDDAFFVKCDSETTTQNDINLGIVNVLVGFAPLKPAEFVILSLQQMAGQVEV